MDLIAPGDFYQFCFLALCVLAVRNWFRLRPPFGRRVVAQPRPGLFLLLDTILIVSGLWWTQGYGVDDYRRYLGLVLVFFVALYVEGFFAGITESENATPGSSGAPPATESLERSIPPGA